MAASTSVITRVDGRCITVNEVSYIYLLKINDRRTRGPLILSEVHKKIHRLYENVQKEKKQTNKQKIR